MSSHFCERKFGGWTLSELCERREPRGCLVPGGSKPSVIPSGYLMPTSGLCRHRNTWRELTHKCIHIKNKNLKNKKLAPGGYDCHDCTSGFCVFSLVRIKVLIPPWLLVKITQRLSTLCQFTAGRCQDFYPLGFHFGDLRDGSWGLWCF